MEANVVEKFLPVKMNEEKIQRAVDLAGKSGNVFCIVIATKPCFYKLWGIIQECEKQRIPFIVIHSGQHYDNLLGYGIKELSIEDTISIEMNIRGDLSTKSSEMFSKVNWICKYLNGRWPGINFIPYVNGDTITAGIFPAAWMFSSGIKSIDGEAGLRGMCPEFFNPSAFALSAEDFIKKQFNTDWKIMRNEPFPEQWDTYVSAASCDLFFAPVELNKSHLLREGYPEGKIHVSGNTFVDALRDQRKKNDGTSIFDIYPKLENGEWLRVDIHRRENLTKRRYTSIVESVSKLVEMGYNISFIEMNANRSATEKYGLADVFKKMESLPNFIYTPIWQKYNHVIEFLDSSHCIGILTDSGSLQEEMNELGKLCITCRFSTDRPETVMDAKTNILAPPYSGDFTSSVVDYVLKNEGLRKSMNSGKKIYGNDVSKNIVNIMKDALGSGQRPNNWVHEELGLWKEESDMSFQ